MQQTNWTFLETAISPWQYQMAKLSFFLLDREVSSRTQLEDYSFLVFPLAKAFEGFLKDYLLALELIDQDTYRSRRFRIGRVLNPDVHPDQRDEVWLYDDLVQMCGVAVARQLWQTWLECRNHIFHFFPSADASLTLDQARQRLNELVEAIRVAHACQLELKSS